VLEPELPTHELVVTRMHPGVTREQIMEATGWPIHFAAEVRETEPPAPQELATLRDLQRRTLEAHGEVSQTA
jgi:glutaconate CoA-transferase, subunit B